MKKAINFMLDKNKAKLISAFAMKEDITLASFLEKLIDNYIQENKEQAKKLIQAYDLDINMENYLATHLTVQETV
ncbi:MAG: hypothetical protein IJQ47_06975 [Synergistaceae bacterium]|nr:hypothetical protein [Synergistaceae bacterium]